MLELGTYVGDGTGNGRHIAVPWRPKYVVMLNLSRPNDDNMNAIWVDQGGDKTIRVTGSAVEGTPTISVGINNDGFTVSATGTNYNINGENYAWVAIG